jgi:hypothetical protein
MEHGAHANLRRPQRCARRAGAWLCDGACGACVMVSSACRGGWLGNHLVAQQREFAGWIRCSNARKAVWLDGDRRRSCADLVCHWVSEEWLMVGGWRLAQPRPRQNGCAIPISARAASHVPPPPRPPHVPPHVHHHHHHSHHRQIQRPRVPETTLLADILLSVPKIILHLRPRMCTFPSRIIACTFHF